MNPSQIIILILAILEKKDIIEFSERVRIQNFLIDRASNLSVEQVLEDILQLLD